MFVKRDPDEKRTLAQLLEHYEVEKELANQLRRSTAEQRLTLYRDVYSELYRRLPHHPQHTRKHRGSDYVTPQLRLLAPLLTPDVRFLEIGSGDCALGLAVAPRVRCVVAVEVSEEIAVQAGFPPNFSLIVADATRLPLAPESFDVVYSNQVLEHIHPDDVHDHLLGIHRVLRPGGVFVCITPSRLNGPHDISRYFDSSATCLHLKEYCVAEVNGLLRDAGFRKVEVMLGWARRSLRVSVVQPRMLESLLGMLPRAPRRIFADFPILRTLLGVRVIATR